MKDIYFNFPSVEVARQVGQDCDFFTSGDASSLIQFSESHAIDLVGEISGASGYHVNFRTLNDDFVLPAGAEIYVIDTPLTPTRKWL